MVKIKGKYEYPSDFESKHITGAFGGINPQGDVVINFYSELQSLPEAYEITIDEKGGRQEVQSVQSDVDYSRKIVTSIVMNRKTAKSIQLWLEHVVSNDKTDKTDKN